ncbi:MAG: DUF3147 family protein [Novosphingobium sp.]
MWGQLAIKAILSGVLIAAASEVARRSPGWGGLIASLPLVSLLAMLWLWRDTGDAAKIADLALSSSAYVVASLPAFVVLAVMLRRGLPMPLGFAAFVAVAFAGYAMMAWSLRTFVR